MEADNLSNFVGIDSLLKEVGDVVAQAINEKRNELIDSGEYEPEEED